LYTIAAAAASPVPEGGDVPPTDAELKKLRELAGLDQEGSGQ